MESCTCTEKGRLLEYVTVPKSHVLAIKFYIGCKNEEKQFGTNNVPLSKSFAWCEMASFLCSFREIFQESHLCQTVCIQIRPDSLSGLIWVQTVCKGYQLTTKVATRGRICDQRMTSYVVNKLIRVAALCHHGRGYFMSTHKWRHVWIRSTTDIS